MLDFPDNDPRKGMASYRIEVEKKGFRVYGFWASEHLGATNPEKAKSNSRQLLVPALKALTPATRRAIKSIAIIPESALNCEAHFGYIDGDKKRPIIGHCHNNTGHTCFKLAEMNVPLLAHEAAHALTFYLRNHHKGLESEWRQITNAHYGEEQFSKNQLFPFNGFLDKYSSRDVQEHIAVFVEMVFRATLNLHHPFLNVPKTDQRYYRHAELLRQYEFISQNDFDFISPFLR